MKKKIFGIILPIIAILLTIASLSATYAWYTNVTKIGKIDAETKDIAFSYRLNNGTETNVSEYSITNLTFFDIDSENEHEYLPIMATSIRIDLENLSSDQITYTITFSSTVKETKESDNVMSRAYVAGFFSSSETITSNDVSTFVSSDVKNLSTSMGALEINTGSNTDATAFVYLHLIGIQEIDSANNDFLEESYNFAITIKAESENSTPSVTEVTTTSTTTN